MFVNASQAHLFYSSGDRGGSQTEKLLLALILASHEDSCNVRDWAVYSLEDVDDYVDGDSWDVPSTWKKNKERNDVVLRFGEYLKVTPAVIDNVRFAAARNDGLCHISRNANVNTAQGVNNHPHGRTCVPNAF